MNTLFENTGKIEYHGPFGGTKTYHGLHIDQVKSGLQKYIRRNEKDKAIKCAIELNLFRLIGDKGKALRTTLINRLRIISGEEFAWSNPKIFEYIDKEIENWNKNRNDIILTTKSIVNILEIMSQVKKVRMVSFLRAAFYNGFDYNKIMEKYNDFYNSILSINYDIDGKYDNYILDKDSEILIEYFKKFVYLFEKKDEKCLVWAFKILNMNDKASRRFRRTGSEYIIWNYLLSNFENTECFKPLNILFNWYKYYKSENWIHFINSIMICLEQSKNNLNNDDIEFNKANDDLVKSILNDHKNNELILDDYCFDLHTNKGRKNNKSYVYFANIGSKVEDENISILNLTYKKIYVDIKYIKETGDTKKHKKIVFKIKK